MTDDIDKLRREIEKLRQEVAGVHELLHLISVYGHGMRFIVRDGQKVLQYFNNIGWADVPTIVNPIDDEARTLGEVLGFEFGTDHPKA